RVLFRSRDRDEPHAHHAADPVGLRPDLHHDRRRTRPAVPDPAAVHVRAGLLLRAARLRHRRGAAAPAHRGARLDRLPAPAARGGQAMTAAVQTPETRTTIDTAPRPAPRRRMTRAAGTATASNAVMIAIGIAFLVPLLWVVLASFDTEASLSVAWPERFSLGNYAAIWNAETTFRPLWNSLILCGGATVLTMVSAVLCAYPLSRYRFRAKRPLLLTIIFSTGLPITAIMIPVYSMFVQVNLIDSMGGAILFLGASALPYAIFLTKGFMDGVPLEIEESAWTEGSGVLRTLWSVVLPLMRSGLSVRSEEHTSELQSRENLVCRLLLEKKKNQ